MDKTQKQNKKVVKVDGEKIGIFENKRTLVECELPGSYITGLIHEIDHEGSFLLL